MTPRMLFLVIFVEGFCSLGAEVLALRQLIPHTGSTIVVTAPTIGLFLLALALGYHAGARVNQDFAVTVARNFVAAAFAAGIGLAGNTVDAIFTHISPPWLAYLLLVGLVLCPLAYWLGQTVPVLTNLMRYERAGEKSGYALFHSTLGSFLGSLTLSLVIMQWLGVSAAVLCVALPLFAGAIVLQWRRPVLLAAAVSGVILTLAFNQRIWLVAETAYANYAVKAVKLGGAVSPRAFLVNNSYSSLIDESTPPSYARYVRHVRRLLIDELRFRDKDILVLGAGGFTLSHREAANRYVYVDVDPHIRKLAEQHFLKEKALGEFVVDDARNYVRVSDRRFSAVIVDVYTSRTSIPAHLVTREFWEGTRRVLLPDALMIANLILDSRLATPYARNLLATIESVYGRCGVEVLQRDQVLANVVVSCFNSGGRETALIYTDELNRADSDVIRSH